MERADHEIIDFMKRYGDDEKTVLALGELLSFMGIPDGSNLALAACEELQAEKEENDFLRRKYHEYLSARKASEYISFAEYVRMLATGDKTVL